MSGGLESGGLVSPSTDFGCEVAHSPHQLEALALSMFCVVQEVNFMSHRNTRTCCVYNKHLIKHHMTVFVPHHLILVERSVPAFV